MGRLGAPGEYNDSRVSTPGTTQVFGSFTTANTAAPTTPQANNAWTVARIGVGQFRVTFARSYRVRVYADANALANNRLAQVIAFTPGTLRAGATLDIEVQSALGTAVETTGLVVMFQALFQRIVNHRGA